MNVINPIGLSPTQWCDATGVNLASRVPPMKIFDNEGWRDWGVHVIKNLGASGVVVPMPHDFARWDQWAERFNQSIMNLET